MFYASCLKVYTMNHIFRISTIKAARLLTDAGLIPSWLFSVLPMLALVSLTLHAICLCVANKDSYSNDCLMLCSQYNVSEC